VRDKNLCKDMTTEEGGEEEKVYYKVNFKIKENYAVELELEDYDTLDQVLEDLEEVWNKSNKDAAFRKKDFVYEVDEKKTVPLLRIQDIREINKRDGKIRVMTNQEKVDFIRDERIEKPQQLVNECFEISTLRKGVRVELKWRCFIGLFLVRRSSMKRSDLNYLPSARDEMHKILHILDNCTKRHKIRLVPFNSDLDPKYSIFNTKRLKEYIGEAPRFLHFIGHGEHYQLIMDNKQGTGFETVNGNYVLELIKSQHSLECVFLNCCNSYVR
jgi:hypothetical protein